MIPQMLFYDARMTPLDSAITIPICTFMNDLILPRVFQQVNGEEFALSENMDWKNMSEVESASEIV
jgi:hypothetical protein